ncbi:hypothetical protein Plhal710r2_c006g0029161 [Plasmopara halstedii]
MQLPKRTHQSPTFGELAEIGAFNNHQDTADANEYLVHWADSSEPSWLSRCILPKMDIKIYRFLIANLQITLNARSTI